MFLVLCAFILGSRAYFFLETPDQMIRPTLFEGTRPTLLGIFVLHIHQTAGDISCPWCIGESIWCGGYALGQFTLMFAFVLIL